MIARTRSGLILYSPRIFRTKVFLKATNKDDGKEQFTINLLKTHPLVHMFAAVKIYFWSEH